MRASTTSQLIPFRSLWSGQSASPLILVIDDEPVVPQLLARLLEPLGFRVITAENGEQGVAQFLQEAPAVTLVDILMPVQDGIETILQMRRHRPNANIIAMSGGGRIEGTHYLAIAVKLGANVALEKPINFDKLLIALRTLLHQEPGTVAHSEESPRPRGRSSGMQNGNPRRAVLVRTRQHLPILLGRLLLSPR